VAFVKSPDELTEVFRQRGLKVTPQRQAIFRALHDNPEHPTAESVYDAVRSEVPSISLRTVYQTLNDLATMGELRQLSFGPGSARFDPNGDDHHHLVCEACGKVVDVYADTSGVALPPADRQGFTIATTQVVFRGRCADCSTHARQSHQQANQQEETIHA
jgi:Fe2+ or Zn2+ uptake regulation protein